MTCCPVCGSENVKADLVLFGERLMVVRGDRFVLLPDTQFEILALFVRAYPRMVSRQSLMNWLYQLRPDEEPEPKILDVYVCHLRRKLKPLGVGFETVWGRGWVMTCDSEIRVIAEECTAAAE